MDGQRAQELVNRIEENEYPIEVRQQLKSEPVVEPSEGVQGVRDELMRGSSGPCDGKSSGEEAGEVGSRGRPI